MNLNFVGNCGHHIMSVYKLKQIVVRHSSTRLERLNIGNRQRTLADIPYMGINLVEPCCNVYATSAVITAADRTNFLKNKFDSADIVQPFDTRVRDKKTSKKVGNLANILYLYS